MAVATALTVAAIGVGLGQAGMSFAQVGKEKRKAKEAEINAQRALSAANKDLEKNYAEQLSIYKEPYELEREALMVTGAQAIEGLRESDRGLARVPAVQQAIQQGQRKIATAMGTEGQRIKEQVVGEDMRLRDLRTQIQLGEVAGQQMAQADAEEAAAQYMQQGMQGIQQASMAGLSLLPEAAFDPNIAAMNKQKRINNRYLRTGRGSYTPLADTTA
jgi:hypothetical protein